MISAIYFAMLNHEIEICAIQLILDAVMYLHGLIKKYSENMFGSMPNFE